MRNYFGTSLTVPGADRWYDEIRAGRAFSQRQFFTPVVGENANVQLFNPAGSGVNLIIRKVFAELGTSGALLILSHNTALTTAGNVGVNLLNGGAAAQGLFRTVSNAGALGTQFRQLAVLSTQSLAVIDDWYMELGPGEGINFAANAVTVSPTINADWIELPV